MGKTRDLLGKIRDTKRIFHAKMGTIKDRDSMDLTEAEDIKKRQQEYTEELYKKDVNDPDNHDSVITHLKPDILECEVRWALGSITMNKASEGDGIPAELLQILKQYAAKVLHSLCQQIWKTQQWSQNWKRSVFIPIPMKGNAKACTDYCTFFSHFTCQKGNAQNRPSQASEVCATRTSRCTSWIQQRQKNQRSNCEHPLDHRKSKGIPEKVYFCFIDYAKALDCVDHNKLENS